jgi:hypothetical protein
MADIVHPIPWQISNFLPGTPNSGGYALSDYQFDYALGGIPFLSATRDAWPYSEGMAEIRKQQFDSSAEPGEQSIYGWWLRSQNSWTSGAGLLYQDPDVVNPYTRSFDLRFDDSLGVDNWTPGQATLLKQPVSKYNVGGTFARVRGYVDPSGVDAAFYMDGNLLYKMTDSTRTAITTGSAGTALGFTNFGTSWFLLATDGIWKGVDTGAGAKIWNNPAGTLTSGVIEVVKQRLIAGWNNALYILTIDGTAPVGPPAPPALPAAWAGGYGLVMTHPDTTWQWTSATEGPSAIYTAGQNATDSSIYRFASDLSSSIETFVPIVTAQLPRGELVRTIYAYVGTFVGIATNKGFRVGELDAGGDISYGPLLFQPTGGCQSLAGFDRFMYVGTTNAHDGATGVFRVDLGTAYTEASTSVLRYAYARDVYSPNQTGTVSSVSIFGASGRVVYTIAGNSIWLQSATDLYPSGYLRTGRIRYNTEEPKLYKFMSVSTPDPLAGNLALSIIDIQGTEWPSLTYTPTLNPETNDVTISQPSGRQIWIKLKFVLSRGSDVTKGAILNGWQVKALPGSIRQRMINHTFLLFDEEKDKGNQRVGTDGYARSRFEAFKELAREGDVVVFQELIEDRSTLVVIDDWKFTQLAPPGPGGAALGGYLTVVLRTVAESV